MVHNNFSDFREISIKASTYVQFNHINAELNISLMFINYKKIENPVYTLTSLSILAQMIDP